MKYLHCMCISRIMALARQSKSALPFVNFFFSSSTLSLSFSHFWLGNLEIYVFYYSQCNSHTQKNHTCFDQHVSILLKWHQCDWWVHGKTRKEKRTRCCGDLRKASLHLTARMKIANSAHSEFLMQTMHTQSSKMYDFVILACCQSMTTNGGIHGAFIAH